MKIRLWGVRGSIPSPGPATFRYGGNTSCVELTLDDGSRIILDAGSGIRPLGVEVGAFTGTLVLSHYHWDHIQGMPFFAPSYVPDSSIVVMGPEVDGMGPIDLLSRQMLAPYFPAPASQWLGIVGDEIVRGGSRFTVGAAEVTAAWMSHPGPTLGYRFREGKHTVVYMSDNEVEVASRSLLTGMIDLAADADLLIHDTQYTQAEYRSRRGWGHSTPRQVIRVAQAAGVRRVMLFHHDPGHSDEQVELQATEARRLAGDEIEILIAREGETHLIEEGAAATPVRVARGEAV